MTMLGAWLVKSFAFFNFQGILFLLYPVSFLLALLEHHIQIWCFHTHTMFLWKISVVFIVTIVKLHATVQRETVCYSRVYFINIDWNMRIHWFQNKQQLSRFLVLFRWQAIIPQLLLKFKVIPSLFTLSMCELWELRVKLFHLTLILFLVFNNQTTGWFVKLLTSRCSGLIASGDNSGKSHHSSCGRVAKYIVTPLWKSDFVSCFYWEILFFSLLVRGFKSTCALCKRAFCRWRSILPPFFVDTRLWKTKHPRKRFQNFR